MPATLISATEWFDISSSQLFHEIGALPRAGFDELPFGAIVLDSEGRVVTYNAAEARFAQRNVADVIGRNFFREIAPCARVREFGGVIESAPPDEPIEHSLLFTFRFASGFKQAKIRVVRNPAMSPRTYIFVDPTRAVGVSPSDERSKVVEMPGVAAFSATEDGVANAIRVAK